MPRQPVADFVDSFFTRTLFQSDDAVAESVFATELSPDAEINIDGNSLSVESFVGLITTQFRTAFIATITAIQDLNIVTTNDEGTTGTVAQYTKYETKGKADGKILKQSATTIVRVEEREGRRVVTALWEAQTVDQA